MTQSYTIANGSNFKSYYRFIGLSLRFWKTISGGDEVCFRNRDFRLETDGKYLMGCRPVEQFLERNLQSHHTLPTIPTRPRNRDQDSCSSSYPFDTGIGVRCPTLTREVVYSDLHSCVVSPLQVVAVTN
nr:hypothetical protein Iba_chr08cCG14620 [Ipomoea batatas]